MISGFRQDIDEICVLLRHYAAYSGNSVLTFLSHLQGARSSGLLNVEVGTDRLCRNVLFGMNHFTLLNVHEGRRS
jgi:hypothetical protein